MSIRPAVGTPHTSMEVLGPATLNAALDMAQSLAMLSVVLIALVGWLQDKRLDTILAGGIDPI